MARKHEFNAGKQASFEEAMRETLVEDAPAFERLAERDSELPPPCPRCSSSRRWVARDDATDDEEASAAPRQAAAGGKHLWAACDACGHAEQASG